MSQMALIGSPTLASQGKASHRPQPAALSSTWRFTRREENIAGLSWTVAIALSFLIIGVVGVFQKEVPLIITLAGRAGLGASDANSTELTMAELHAMEDAPEVVTQEVEPVPEVELVQPQEILPDLPELAEALITEDVFTVPAAPRIEDALTPVDPAKPKPKPAPVRPRSSRPTTVASGTPGGTQGSGGGGGGSTATGSGSGGGRMPRPSYPSSARARGVSGTMMLALSVSPAGAVESAAVVSCEGSFTSGEQATVASFVRRNWRFPTGAYRKHTVPIVFKLDRR